MQTITQNLTIPPVTRNKLLLLFVGLAILLRSRGFYLKALTLSEHFEVFMIAMVFLVAAAFVIRTPSILMKGVLKKFYSLAVLGIIAIAFFSIFINSVVIRGHSMLELPRQGFNYAALLICLVLISCRTDSAFVPNLNAVVVGINSVIVLLYVIVSFIPGLASSMFILVSSRFEAERLTSPLGAMVVYSFLYCLVMCTSGARSTKIRAIFFALFVFYLWYFLFVDMTRRYIIGLMIVAIFYWLFHLKIGRKAMTLIMAFFLLTASLVFTNVGDAVFESVVNIFSSSIEDYQSNKGTVGGRIEGIKYYMNEFADGGFIGIGPGKFSLGADRSEDIPYNPSDHGLIAVLYQYGFQGIILTVIILYFMFRDLRAVCRHGPRQYQPIAMAIRLYLCFTIVALLQIYWKPSFALWVGIMLFMTWRMREEMRRNHSFVQKQNRFPGRAIARGT